MKVRRVMALTGKRGGFGAMILTFQAIESDPDLELQLVVTDQHMSDCFGKTVSEVERLFPVAADVDMAQSGDSGVERTKALSRCMTEMVEVIDRLDPDLVMLYGDRGEVLATAIAATHLCKPIVHIQGGDVSGSLDEPMRHAITKLAHLHLPSTEESADRIRKMGEESDRVHVVGDLHIDMICKGEIASPDETSKAFDLDLGKPTIIVLQHSVSTEPGQAYDQMKETLAAVLSFEVQTVIVYPCSDAGYDGVIRAIKEDVQNKPSVQVHTNIEAFRFWGLMKVASVLVGNSSAGLIETPYFPIPAVNVGSRQRGRLHAENVLHVPHRRHEIESAIRKSLKDSDFRTRVVGCSRPYGDGEGFVHVVRALKQVDLGNGFLQKRMTY